MRIHNKGDDVLRLVAGILTSQCRKSDMVFRIGGDEFVLLVQLQVALPINSVSNMIVRYLGIIKVID